MVVELARTAATELAAPGDRATIGKSIHAGASAGPLAEKELTDSRVTILCIGLEILLDARLIDNARAVKIHRTQAVGRDSIGAGARSERDLSHRRREEMAVTAKQLYLRQSGCAKASHTRAAIGHRRRHPIACHSPICAGWITAPCGTVTIHGAQRTD